MENYNLPDGDAGGTIGLTTPALVFAIFVLSLFASLLSLMRMAQIGPDVGEIVVFDPNRGARYWEAPGIVAPRAPVVGQTPAGAARSCVLMPSVMAAEGGSLVLEAKEITRPATYRVHWSGARTDRDGTDCGRSADLMLELAQVRALAQFAGGWGVRHGTGLF